MHAHTEMVVLAEAALRGLPEHAQQHGGQVQLAHGKATIESGDGDTWPGDPVGWGVGSAIRPLDQAATLSPSHTAGGHQRGSGIRVDPSRYE